MFSLGFILEIFLENIFLQKKKRIDELITKILGKENP